MSVEQDTIKPPFLSAGTQGMLDGFIGYIQTLRQYSLLPRNTFEGLNSIANGAIRNNTPHQEPIFKKGGKDIFAYESLSSIKDNNGKHYSVEDTKNASLAIGTTEAFDLLTCKAGIDKAKENGCFDNGGIVAFNISVPSAFNPEFCIEFHKLFCEADINPNQVIIEIQEVREDSPYTIDPNAKTEHLDILINLDYILALDDIGLRPSDLVRLQLLGNKATIAKVDGIYIRGWLEENGFEGLVPEESRSGLSDVMSNINTYMPGARLVAECVHTLEEAKLLNQKLGFGYFQGRELTSQIAPHNFLATASDTCEIQPYM